MRTDSDLRSLSASDIASLVNAGKLTALDVVSQYITAIESTPQLNAFITTCFDQALSRARETTTGPLAGVPIAVKDMFDTAGVRTTRGTRLFANHVPGRTAEAVARLQAAGAIVIGKANQHEIAWGVTSQNPHWGNVQNPVDPTLTPGGSSGGNAAAIAARLCVLGIGTDTGGSGRIPSACCNTVGFRPRQKSIPRRGCFPLAPVFDTVAPMSATVSDCILAFSVLSQRKVRRRDIRKIRIGSLVDMPELSEFSQLGAKTVGITPIPAPRFDFSKVYRAQAAITHRRWFPSRSSEYGPDAQAKLHYARRALAVDYYDGLLELRRWRTMINRSDPPDIIIAPTLGSAIPPADVSEPTIRDELGRYTRIFSYLDWPAVAIGPLQLAGPDEDTVLSAALELERSRSALGRPAESSAPRPRDTARGHLGGRGHG